MPIIYKHLADRFDFWQKLGKLAKFSIFDNKIFKLSHAYFIFYQIMFKNLKGQLENAMKFQTI